MNASNNAGEVELSTLTKQSHAARLPLLHSYFNLLVSHVVCSFVVARLVSCELLDRSGWESE